MLLIQSSIIQRDMEIGMRIQIPFVVFFLLLLICYLSQAPYQNLTLTFCLTISSKSGSYGYTKLELRLYQVVHTSSRKITEVKQLGLRLVIGWGTDQGLYLQCCSKKYCKTLGVDGESPPERGPPLGAKENKKNS